MDLSDIHELMHAVSVGVVGFLVMSCITLVVVFFKLFEGDFFNGE
jgi:hypothetical protein